MRKAAVLWGCAILLACGALTAAEEPQAYLGVSLDPTLLPELLTKHLCLDPGQGIRVKNIMTGSPADKAGLEQDDILTVIEGRKITSKDQFIEAVRAAGPGTEVSIELIRLGQRRTVRVTVAPVPDPKPEVVPWKYPSEPDMVTSWRPGRIFKVGPDGEGMVEIPFDKIPDINLDVKRFFQETYTFRHTTDGEEYTIMIEGSPSESDSQVVVDTGEQQYVATVGTIGTLPESYRGEVREAVKDARAGLQRNISVRGLDLPEILGPEARRRLLESIPRPDLQQLLEQKDEVLARVQQQIERLQQQVKELEKRNREMFDRLLPKGEASEGKDPPPQAPPAPQSQGQSASGS